jgi:hypothetical protein
VGADGLEAIKLVDVGLVEELDVPDKSMWGFAWFPCSAVGVTLVEFVAIVGKLILLGLIELNNSLSAVGIKFVAFVAVVCKLIVLVELIGLNKSVCEFTWFTCWDMQCWFELVVVVSVGKLVGLVELKEICKSSWFSWPVVGVKLLAFVTIVGELVRYVELGFGKSVGEIAWFPWWDIRYLLARFAGECGILFGEYFKCLEMVGENKIMCE